MTDTAWSEVFTELRGGCTSGEAEIARAEAELGFALPDSYRSFCAACGAGLAGGFLRIATPLPYPAADLVVRAELIAHSVSAAIRTLGSVPGPDAEGEHGPPHRFEVEGGDPGILDRACFFGEGEDGSFLFWDVQGTGEYDVWVLAADLETVRFGGESLFELFRRLQGPAAASVLGPGAEPLPARFEGIEAATLARASEALSGEAETGSP